MSKRPTNQVRRAPANNTSSSNNYGYAVIGDTVEATLYAKRLIANNVNTPIYIISEGVDRTNINEISDVAFAANNTKKILHYLKSEQIHMVPSGDNNEVDDDSDSAIIQTERIIQYYVGSGPLGNFISAYHIPRIGPWFTHSSSGRLERFLIESTLKSALKDYEAIIADRISRIWGLPLTSSITVTTPSVLNVHYEFLEQYQNTYTREIFLDEYNMVNQSNNVDYITEARNLHFTTSTGSTGSINITGTNISINNVHPIWKTNPYTYLRLATEGGLNPAPMLLPTFYRAVLSIPVHGTGTTGPTGITGGSVLVPGPTGYICFAATGSTGLGNSPCNDNVSNVGGPIGLSGAVCYIGLTGITGVNLSNASSTEDLVTSHITFSLHDIANPRHSGLAWLIQAYTVPEDLSIVHPDGSYADSSRTLLIIEALSTKNRRRTSYNIAEREIQVNYNDRIAETGYLRQFAQIVASVYNAYTGTLISVDTLVADASVCSATSGTCHDANTVTDYALRESPMVSVLELASHMYGLDIYPFKC